MRMQQMFGRLWTYWMCMTAVVGDALLGAKVDKAFANEHREVARFDRPSYDYVEKENAIHWVWTSLQAMVSGLMQISSLLIWVVGGYMVVRAGSDSPIDVETLV